LFCVISIITSRLILISEIRVCLILTILSVIAQNVGLPTTKTWYIRKRRKKHLNCFNFPYYNNNKNFTKNQEIFFFSCQHISDPCIIEQTKKSICNLLFVSIIPFPSQGFEGPIFFAITCICSSILTHQGRFWTHTPPFKAQPGQEITVILTRDSQ
jgi:hypothetical protein